MTFPNLRNKHEETALFNPQDKTSKEVLKRTFPKKWILTYNYEDMGPWIEKTFSAKKIPLDSTMDVYITPEVGFAKFIGFGSPYTVFMVEQLIVLGGTQFINIGTAGGLHTEGIVVCTKALRDEGTSHHYISSKDPFSYPDKKMSEQLKEALQDRKINFIEGPSWTIDAPFRETVKEVATYSKKGMRTVEMESSALFALAAYRNVQMASVFVVSDVLGTAWKNKFGTSIVDTVKTVIHAGVDCLKS